MNNRVHIYCDESCHLEKDGQQAMVLGAVTCLANVRKRVGRAIKRLKADYGIPPSREIKWTQISPSTQAFYEALIDLFFAEQQLGFRAVVVPNKQMLEHERFGNKHDDFYYKMWWQHLKNLIDDDRSFRVFVDIKDTHSGEDRKSTRLNSSHVAKPYAVVCVE